jgi:uncharacterized membrane protein (DUF2068 family)
MLRLIAAFKLLKGLLLLGVGLTALRLLHGDAAERVRQWAHWLSLNPHNRFIESALARVSTVDEKTLVAVGAGSFFYAALLLTEGIGLWLRRRWAEYFTVIVTSSFIPLEIYEIVKHVTVPRLVVLAVNAAIVVYLVLRLRRERRARPQPRARRRRR